MRAPKSHKQRMIWKRGAPLENHFKRSVSEGITLVAFNAAWCQPCRRQVSIIEKLSHDFMGTARVRMLDIDKHQGIALNLGIQSIPTTIIYKDGEEVKRFVGLQSAEILESALQAAIDTTLYQVITRQHGRHLIEEK
jgi:thioredoxin 1